MPRLLFQDDDRDPYARYCDGSGQPQLIEACVLFFDILGTKAMARSPDAVKRLRELRSALEKAIEMAGTEDSTSDQASTWFTDNAVVAIPLPGAWEREPITGGYQVAAACLLGARIPRPWCNHARTALHG